MAGPMEGGAKLPLLLTPLAYILVGHVAMDKKGRVINT